MYARSTTVHARPESVDAGVAHVRHEIMPTIQQMGGCIGLSMLVDRQSGRCIATSAWQSEEAMRSSAEEIRPMRDRLAEVLGGTSMVDEWEIAVLHRDHASLQGACVRATWVRCDPDQVDRAIDVYKLASMPAMEDLDGFCSASLLVDRGSGRIVSSVTYDSLDAMDRNRDDAATIRATGTQEAGLEVLDTCEFELALAHLHVPELA